MTDIPDMTDAELNAAVAEEVMGRKMCPIHHSLFCCDRGIGNYATDVSDDYEVLKVVRKWRLFDWNRFGRRVRGIWNERLPQSVVDWPDVLATLYEPGDYARAALKAVRQERKS